MKGLKETGGQEVRSKTWAALPLWARPIYAVSHPAMLFPVAILGIFLFGGYDGGEITYARIPLFLQGSTDLGGSDIFSATVALYAIFGILGAMYLTLRLWVSPRRPSHWHEWLSSVWILKFHVVLFVIVWEARGVRHGIMLRWHRLCDQVLGDISEE